MKKVVIGILAHVDAGKTTLSENLLYFSGAIRRLGRVDNKDTFLDTSYMEKNRGITIFSKQAIFEYKNTKMVLIDTPGHVDFSTEMERTLNVLDYVILVISGSEGIQCHTKTLWKLCEKHNIPVFIFVNKMDHPMANKEVVMQGLLKNLSSECIDFSNGLDENAFEKMAMSDEDVLNQYIETGKLDKNTIEELISTRKIYPVLFGSALKNEGIQELLDIIDEYTVEPKELSGQGGYVYKISRDEQGNRLTHMKITGGKIKPKDLIGDEKINQIRLYSGEKYESVSESSFQDICVVTGLENTYCGMAFGCDNTKNSYMMIPVLNYKLVINDGTDPLVLYSKISLLEEEDPSLNVSYNEQLKEISLQVCGRVQMEILKEQIKERFGMDVDFGKGRILYKETIRNTVMGVGHFEPLRHYSEVHTLLEPGDNGSGIVVENDCSEDILDKNWQKVIISNLQKIKHKGVLTGAPLTDVKITLLAGKAHKKHTEGGDFRQACIRSVRQGLMQAESILLEPFYDYVLELPDNVIGRAIHDIENMSGTFSLEQNTEGYSVLTGSAPVSTMYDYQQDVVAYSKGEGRLFLTIGGYKECHNTMEILENFGYEPRSDLKNPIDSVFCANGAGYIVPWNEVFDYMHVESRIKKNEPSVVNDVVVQNYYEEESIGTEEIDAIIEKTFYANKKDKHTYRNGVVRRKVEDLSINARSVAKKPELEKYLLVDGYNIIFAWDELKELAVANMDAAKGMLLDVLCNYQAMKKCELIVVFDAYKVIGHKTETSKYHNINVIYTREAQTADQYIERFAQENSKKYDITVATSDGLEQIIIRGQGCKLLSAREFLQEIRITEEYVRKNYTENS